MTIDARRGARLELVCLLALFVAACNPAPTAAPTGGVSPSAASPGAFSSSPGAPPSETALSPSAGGAWSVADVRQPSDVTDAPSLAPGYFCSPCHAPAQSLLLGLATAPDRLLAVGVEQPPARPIVYASTDGRAWTPSAQLPTTGPASAAAVVATASLTVVVGNSGPTAASWAAGADGSWHGAPAQSALDGPVGGSAAMTSVVAMGDHVVAAGYIDDPAHGSQAAAAWRSSDGLTWTLDRSPATFKGARILGLAVRGSTVVAVGTLGDPTYGSAVAWLWTEARGWEQARVGGSDGAMHAVAAAAQGFVAVGHGPGDHGAAVWTSSDGSAWAPVPDQPAFHPTDGAARMLSIAAGPGGLLVGGWREDAANGSTAAWQSPDGVTWTGFDWVPSFSGGEMAAVATWQGLLVGAGRTGYPDNNQATVWIRAAG